MSAIDSKTLIELHPFNDDERLFDSLPMGRGDAEVSSPFRLDRTDQGVTVTFPEIVQLFLHRDGCRIKFTKKRGVSAYKLRHIILDQYLPRVLAYRRQIVVHAATINVERCAIALLGESGRGKSTLGAFFDINGFSILGDDCMVVSNEHGEMYAWSTYPSLRLLADSMSYLGLDQDNNFFSAHDYTKFRIRHPSLVEDTLHKLPLAALFILAPECAPWSDNVVVRRLSPRETCMVIMANSFQLDVADAQHVTGLFSQVSEMANRIPAYELSYSRDFARLPEVLSAVLSRQGEWLDPANPLEKATTV